MFLQGRGASGWPRSLARRIDLRDLLGVESRCQVTETAWAQRAEGARLDSLVKTGGLLGFGSEGWADRAGRNARQLL